MSGNRIYWDASIWVAWANNEDGKRYQLTSILKDAELGNSSIVLSTFVFAEFASLNSKDEKLFNDYLKRSSFTIVTLNRKIAEEARVLVQKFNFSGADAVHIATAIYAEAEFFYTYDKKVLKKAKQIDDVCICEPQWPNQGVLELETDVVDVEENKK